MKELKKYFDEYTIKARILPGITIIAPLIIVSGFFFSKIDLTLNSIFLIGLLTLMGIISRNLGKKIENKIIKKLGAFQTTIYLRYSDSNIDTYTKTRYHNYLNSKIDNLNMPVLPEKEDENRSQADDMYNSAVRWLRINRRDKIKYPLVHKDLITYGYARNLLGLKLSSIVLYSFIIVCSIIYTYLNGNLTDLYLKNEFLFSILTLIVSILILIIGITKKIVISQGFAYARSILETCDNK